MLWGIISGIVLGRVGNRSGIPVKIHKYICVILLGSVALSAMVSADMVQRRSCGECRILVGAVTLGVQPVLCVLSSPSPVCPEGALEQQAICAQAMINRQYGMLLCLPASCVHCTCWASLLACMLCTHVYTYVRVYVCTYLCMYVCHVQC